MEFSFEVWNNKNQYSDTYEYEINYNELQEKIVEYLVSDTKEKMGKMFEEIGALQCANTIVYNLDVFDKLIEYYTDRIIEDYQEEAQEKYNENIEDAEDEEKLYKEIEKSFL